jgi:hypothetical protein
MRNLFLVLLLANLGFAAWHFWYAPALQFTPRVEGTETIVLRSELDGRGEVRDDDAEETDSKSPEPLAFTAATEAGDASADVLALAEATAEADGCISFGPFADALAAQAEAVISDSAFEFSRRSSVDDVWLGRWVYIDRISTQSQASAIADEMHSAGITEAYVITGADTGNLVSLGVFSQATRAERRIGEARDLGYEPTVSNRLQTGDSVWLDVSTEPQRSGELLAIVGALPGAETYRQDACGSN